MNDQTDVNGLKIHNKYSLKNSSALQQPLSKGNQRQNIVVNEFEYEHPLDFQRANQENSILDYTYYDGVLASGEKALTPNIG